MSNSHKSSSLSIVIATGLALFSMFFGSGNLVFPIAVGQESGGLYGHAALGIILSGVVVPFMGVFGMLLCKGDFARFFGAFGPRGRLLFAFLALALMGPFGVMARCLTVAHGALLTMFPELSIVASSLILSIFIFALSLNKSRIMTSLGVVLTPFFLLAIGAIALMGFLNGGMPERLAVDGWAAFKNGYFQGYQTMDLLAAFFFSQFIISHLYSMMPAAHDERTVLKVFVKASLLGAAILATVYAALVTLGWIYSPILAGQPPQEMLGLIALAALGPFAAPCVCLAVVFACVTTAMVLASLFADFLRCEIAKERIGNHTALVVTLAIGFAVSTLDFVGIAKFLGPLLETVYPALIVLTISNIVSWYFQCKNSHWPFTAAIVAKICSI
jgi:LIVCS family branched-chain amino acid:cation transporter